MENICETKEKHKKTSLSFTIIIMVMIYILFALKRIKFSFASDIDGVALNNEVWLFPLLLFVKASLSSKKRNIDISFFLLYFGLFIVILLGGFNILDHKQFIYAVLQLMVPMLFLFSINQNDIDYLDRFLKILVIFCLIYSLLAIVASTNYGFLMDLLGNKTNYQYYSQYRASLMLGSSITVSYYLNLTLPLCFYLYYSLKDKRWKMISLITIASNLIATMILLSRLSFIIALFILLFYLVFVKNYNISGLRKISIIVIILSAVLFSLNNFTLTRLFSGFKDVSIQTRFIAMDLGMYLFKENLLFGTGLGRYFTRAYSERVIYVNGVSGLVDPHNTYIFALSEIGIIGFIIIGFIFIKITSILKNIRNPVMRKTGYIVLIAYLMGAFGGSHLFNEISFSTIFWIYMSFFRAISIRDNKVTKSLLNNK